MKLNSLTFAKSVRDIYLNHNVNFSGVLKMDMLNQSEVDLSHVFGPDQLSEYLSHFERLDTARYGDAGPIDFTDNHDFSVANDQKRYGKHRLVEEIFRWKKARSGADRAPLRVLSIGTGEGVTAMRYGKAFAFGESDHIIGLDLYEKYLADARKNVPGMETHEVDLNALGGEVRMPVASNSIDLAECSMTAHHMEKFDVLLDEVARTLKPGGAFFYVDLIDKTQTEDSMVFENHHDYPEYHGVEFYRSAGDILAATEKRLKLTQVTRIGPGYIFLGAEKA